MTISADTLFFITEIIGTIAFSISGAIPAIKRRLDLFGVIFLGVTAACGGGIIRDLMLGQVPPQAFINPTYVFVAALTALLVFMVYWADQQAKTTAPFFSGELLNFCDAAGLGIFSVIGVQNTVNAGFGDNAFFCIFLGMLTGVGGGMLRDVMSRSTPAVLRKHIYALASIIGSACYYCLHLRHRWMAIAITVALVVAIRMLASRYKWSLPRISIPEHKD